ncbi:hypothetical protein, partial [Gordonibacter sp.]|uniref:hypothetical protein n=1 Tax=Gordonibacter sp. TaxID=1968902 RepID=UPI002FC9D67B
SSPCAAVLPWESPPYRSAALPLCRILFLECLFDLENPLQGLSSAMRASASAMRMSPGAT